MLRDYRLQTSGGVNWTKPCAIPQRKTKMRQETLLLLYSELFRCQRATEILVLSHCPINLSFGEQHQLQ